jgi:hypothetical protein
MKSMDDLSQTPVSSPISTGGEGVFFEQHVAAYWLAQLLVRSIPPIMTDTGVTAVHLQTEHLGFNTDDFLVVCARAGRTNARLVGQVKRSFTISAADDECKKAIGDFWKDFKKANPFNPQHYAAPTRSSRISSGCSTAPEALRIAKSSCGASRCPALFRRSPYISVQISARS